MVGKFQSCHKDCETILSHLKHHEEQLKIKRRWLMGLFLYKSEKKKLVKHRLLPESLLREDDIFYETVKKHVEEAFGVHAGERGDNIIQVSTQLFNGSNLKGLLLSCIDALTSKGLFLLAMLLTRGSVNFDKTRPKMKKVIKESIPGVVGDQNHNMQLEIFNQLSQLLNDPQNIRDNCLTLLIPSFHSHQASAIKILNKLEDLPSHTLHAMRRKLRGIPAATPCLQQKKGINRKELIHNVRRTIKKMLSELGRGDELQPPLAKALAVAGLSLKVTQGLSNFFVEEFNQFSPEIKTLQNEITKAIWLLDTRVKFPELKTLQLLFDPNANVSDRSLRIAMRKMLTDYLFECSDLDTIPKSLSKALAIINNSGYRSELNGCFLKEEIEEEVECILSVSAEMKQIILDLHPDHEFDEDFTDAYMEELEESEDSDDDYHDKNDVVFPTGDSDDDGQKLQPRNILSSRTYSTGLDNLEEGCGEHVPVDSKGNHKSSLFQEKGNVNGVLNVERMGKFETSRIIGNCFSPHLPSNSPHLPSNGRLNSISIEENEPEQGTSVDPGNPDLPSSSRCYKQSSQTNLYLGVQEVCDEMSMIAYNLVGYMMEKFAQEEGLDLDLSDRAYLRGDYSSQENQEERQNSSERNVAGSVIVQVVEELIPSLPKSGMDKLKELMGIV